MVVDDLDSTLACHVHDTGECEMSIAQLLGTDNPPGAGLVQVSSV